MCRVRIQAWMPEQRDGELRHVHRQREAMHAAPQALRMSLRHGRDHVGLASKHDGWTESAYRHRVLSRQAELFESVIDRCHFEAAAGNQYVRSRGITLRRHLSPAQRMALANDANETVAEESLRSDLRAHRLAGDT